MGVNGVYLRRIFIGLLAINICYFILLLLRQPNQCEMTVSIFSKPCGTHNNKDSQMDAIIITKNSSNLRATTFTDFNTSPKTISTVTTATSKTKRTRKINATARRPVRGPEMFEIGYTQPPRDLQNIRYRYLKQLNDSTWKGYINKYLSQHKSLCQIEEEKLPADAMPYCPCIPSNLVGFQNISEETVPLLSDIQSKNPEVKEGGFWRPSSCTARMRLAIIIPFRGRAKHLAILLKYLHPVLQGQQLEYTIYVVEQLTPAMFNKAVLMNAGFRFANSSSTQPNCFIFHDVDQMPEDGRHFYWCHPQHALHLGAFNDRQKYRIKYDHIFGGVTAFRRWQFEKVNGFSNRYFGWGGEDDDMCFRLREKKIKIVRDAPEVAGYAILRHERDKGNAQPSLEARLRRKQILLHDRKTDVDGLRNVNYTIREKKDLGLYTLLQIDVLNPDPIEEHKLVQRRKRQHFSKSNDTRSRQ